MSDRLDESSLLHAAVLDVIQANRCDDTTFDALARRILGFQCEWVEPVRRLCARAGFDPSSSEAPVVNAPAVPVEAFRFARIAAHPAASDVRVFLTSGTTGGTETRGAHPMRTLDTYRRAAMRHAETSLWPHEEAEVLSIIVDAVQHPESSLGTMVTFFRERWGGPASSFLSARGLDHQGLASAIRRAGERARPVLFCATSFALLDLIESVGTGACSPQLAPGDLRLPPGSRMMFTGGFKGRTKEMPEEELVRLASEAFGVREADVIGEYGMTELSSQLYQRVAHGRRGYVPPPWLRVYAVDPETMQVLPDGEVGIARFVDLANVDSAMIVQTLDLVCVANAGVTLLGRLPNAPSRGCSLSAEEILG